jgi:Fe-S cluster biosynthesis and repair protein YggX
MPRYVFCTRLQREAEGLDFAPWPGDLGQRVFQTISKEVWGQWLAHQTLLINEHRLSPLNPKTRIFLQTEMEQFLFGDGAKPPSGYLPTTNTSPD